MKTNLLSVSDERQNLSDHNELNLSSRSEFRSAVLLFYHQEALKRG